MKYNDRKHGRAEYGSWVQTSKAYWDSLEQEPLSSGSLELKDQYFSRMVHISNFDEMSTVLSGDASISTDVNNLQGEDGGAILGAGETSLSGEVYKSLIVHSDATLSGITMNNVTGENNLLGIVLQPMHTIFGPMQDIIVDTGVIQLIK